MWRLNHVNVLLQIGLRAVAYYCRFRGRLVHLATSSFHPQVLLERPLARSLTGPGNIFIILRMAVSLGFKIDSRSR